MDIYWNIFTGVLFMERDTVSLNIEAKNRGATQEFELRSIKFKKYISGLRSIFWFPKEA